jgi:chromosomal replication initiation ATPase DnaA
MIDLWPDWPFFALLLYGPKGCGKSHLSHMFAERVAMMCQKPIAVPMIDAREIKFSKVERLHRDNFCLIVENLTPKVDQSALFHLFNLYQNEGGFILFTAEQSPARMGFALPDLRSRLNIIPTVSIAEPDDEMLSALIVKLFTDRQLTISIEVLNYIVQNMHRSFSYAQKLVEEIDAVSLAYKRAISIPIVKEAMAALAAPEQPELF